MSGGGVGRISKLNLGARENVADGKLLMVDGYTATRIQYDGAPRRRVWHSGTLTKR